MAEQGDGADELVSGVGRVLVTGAGVVAENALRRRADGDRDRAEEHRRSAEVDRARTGALLDVDRAGPRQRADEVTAAAVVLADRRSTALDLARDAAARGEGPPVLGDHPADRRPPAAAEGERAPRLAAPVDLETKAATDVAARSFAAAADAAVRGAAGEPKARAPRARTRGRAPERDRGR
jgi:hypothetical protein